MRASSCEPRDLANPIFGVRLACLVSTLAALACGPSEPEVLTGPPTTLYISPGGDDQNDGRSPQTPLKRLERAIQLARGGDTIVVLQGTYSESFENQDIGSESSVMIIRGQDAETRPVFDGQNQMLFMWRCTGCKNLLIENLEIRNYRANGILFSRSQDITIRNLRFVNVARVSDPDGYVEGGSSAIAALDEAIRITIENNKIEDSGFRDLNTDDAGMLINCWRCKDSAIRNNTVRNYEGVGILVEESCRVTATDNRVEAGRNQMVDWWTSALWVDGGRDITVSNNAFQDNEGPGIQASDTEVVYPEGLSKGFKFIGNTSTRNKYGIYIWNYGQCPAPTDAVYLENNTFSGNSDKDIYCVEWECGVGQPCVDATGPNVNCG
ncbi:MAG: hypothetical protein KatS3mg081_1229 [Gemmatimonadales bacterium]|nr:MAG: hypothetical protein KatS3mg081_1229 [Gemmatimonadales bacterium]